ncbi:hypothetical protein ON010_g11247 [Phytophthora cinnamomi]|nr:hypothetical protein ON010_g11247 [Phytophthora cinnamomi]
MTVLLAAPPAIQSGSSYKPARASWRGTSSARAPPVSIGHLPEWTWRRLDVPSSELSNRGLVAANRAPQQRRGRVQARAGGRGGVPEGPALGAHAQRQEQLAGAHQRAQQPQAAGARQGLRPPLQHGAGERQGDVDRGAQVGQGQEGGQARQQGPLRQQDVPARGLGHHRATEPARLGTPQPFIAGDGRVTAAGAAVRVAGASRVSGSGDTLKADKAAIGWKTVFVAEVPNAASTPRKTDPTGNRAHAGAAANPDERETYPALCTSDSTGSPRATSECCQYRESAAQVGVVADGASSSTDLPVTRAVPVTRSTGWSAQALVPPDAHCTHECNCGCSLVEIGKRNAILTGSSPLRNVSRSATGGNASGNTCSSLKAFFRANIHPSSKTGITGFATAVVTVFNGLDEHMSCHARQQLHFSRTLPAFGSLSTGPCELSQSPASSCLAR